MRALHPRLLDARWLDEPARIGSRVEFAVELPPALSLLQPIVGTPRGVLTLVDCQEGQRVQYRLDADRLAGYVELVADRGGPERAVVVSGALWATSSLARTLLAPVSSIAELALARAARRTLARADETLLAGLG